MFSFKRKKEATVEPEVEQPEPPAQEEDKQYIHLTPDSDELAEWQLIDQAELDRRVGENSIEEGSRIFQVEKEIQISFTKTTHLVHYDVPGRQC